jgi:hypothetical protein
MTHDPDDLEHFCLSPSSPSYDATHNLVRQTGHIRDSAPAGDKHDRLALAGLDETGATVRSVDQYSHHPLVHVGRVARKPVEVMCPRTSRQRRDVQWEARLSVRDGISAGSSGDGERMGFETAEGGKDVVETRA